MRRSFKPYSFVGWAVLAWLVAPSVHAAVYDVGRIEELSEIFAADNAESGDHVTDALRKFQSDDTIPVTKMTAVPEVSTWGMMLIWFIGAGLALFRWSRKSSASAFDEEITSAPVRESQLYSVSAPGAAQPRPGGWEAPG
jgi:hypothetical protein